MVKEEKRSMTSKLLLSLDLSTTCTGWALLDLETRELVSHGTIKPKVPGGTKMQYPQKPLERIRSCVTQIKALMEDPRIGKIVIEEINSGKNRIGQKTLDGLHFILLDRIPAKILGKVTFHDSDGPNGWRVKLGLFLSKMDKLVNKEHRRKNKKIKKGSPKLPIITKKDLACRFVNAQYKLSLDCQKRASDGDIADAIGLGFAWLQNIELSKNP